MWPQVINDIQVINDPQLLVTQQMVTVPQVTSKLNKSVTHQWTVSVNPIFSSGNWLIDFSDTVLASDPIIFRYFQVDSDAQVVHDLQVIGCLQVVSES